MKELTHKKYTDIEHFKIEMATEFSVGDDIVVQEKIDGSNASFLYDSERDAVIAFSRNQILDSENDLRGFYGWTQQLDKEKIISVAGTRYKIFGEWLTKHTVAYPEECYRKFYCFDVWDTEKRCYLRQEESMKIADELGLTYVPVFFTGKFTRWSDLDCYVGRTDLGGSEGEGIVVKNMTALNDKKRRTSYTKIVSEKFRETHVVRRHAPTEKQLEQRKQLSADMEAAAAVVTRARVEKLLHKMVDDGMLPEDWNKSHQGIIMKNIGKLVYEDCLKEEPEIVAQTENFGKSSNKLISAILKKIMTDRIM